MTEEEIQKTEEQTEEVQETNEQPQEETQEQPQEAQKSQQESGETEQQGNPRYQTLKSEEFKYGTNNFIEVARKKVDDAEFISLSKGYYTKRGTKRWKNGLGFPDEDEIKNFFIETLKDI